MANEHLRELKQIKRQLTSIASRTEDPKRAFLNGVLYGAGWFVGSVCAVALVGWILSFLGVIPGLDALAAWLSSVVQYSR